MVDREAVLAAEAFTFVRMTRATVDFRVVRMNREVARGLWAACLQEIIYMSSTASERGSIQNNAIGLRNLTLSSSDLPAGESRGFALFIPHAELTPRQLLQATRSMFRR